MKLRLFALRDPASNKLDNSQYFPDKVAAKKERDRINTAQKTNLVVTPGPDHRRYKTVN